jgi:hypothetical protein
MNTNKSSKLRTFLEYMGRGATPVDGYHWIETQRAPGIAHDVKREARWADTLATTTVAAAKSSIWHARGARRA